jgi:hypothetical protein
MVLKVVLTLVLALFVPFGVLILISYLSKPDYSPKHLTSRTGNKPKGYNCNKSYRTKKSEKNIHGHSIPSAESMVYTDDQQLNLKELE